MTMHDERWLPRSQVENLEGSKSYKWKGLEIKFNEKSRGNCVFLVVVLYEYRQLNKNDSQGMAYSCVAKYGKTISPSYGEDSLKSAADIHAL